MNHPLYDLQKRMFFYHFLSLFSNLIIFSRRYMVGWARIIKIQRQRSEWQRVLEIIGRRFRIDIWGNPSNWGWPEYIKKWNQKLCIIHVFFWLWAIGLINPSFKFDFFFLFCFCYHDLWNSDLCLEFQFLITRGKSFSGLVSILV